MNYPEIMRSILFAIVVGLASGVGRDLLIGPDAELLRRVEALEQACDSVAE